MDEIKELYIEPTSECNLNCVMCSRKNWQNEQQGHMDLRLFDKIINEIPESVTRIFFGGVGEPLYHPDIIYMIRRAKETGRTVEMITNGTLLDSEMSDKIVDAELDMLWISLDSLEETSYESIRSGAKFTSVMSNIRMFNKIRGFVNTSNRKADCTIKTRLGISFVLMKQNLHEYKNLLRNAYSLGITDIRASHLIVYDQSQANQVCYEKMFGFNLYSEPWSTSVCVDMPPIDTLDVQENDLLPLLSNPTLSFSFGGTPFRIKTDYCRFVQEGVAFVRWDGEVCPCMALLHENTIYQQKTERYVQSCSYGNALHKTLLEIWNDEPYSSFRKRVIDFVFSPCTNCGPCQFFETNLEDCHGNTFPTCGACLWARGLIQCP